MIDDIIKILEANLEKMGDKNTYEIDGFRKLLEDTPELVALIEEKSNQGSSQELRQEPQQVLVKF